jgi:outer membrane protein
MIKKNKDVLGVCLLIALCLLCNGCRMPYQSKDHTDATHVYQDALAGQGPQQRESVVFQDDPIGLDGVSPVMFTDDPNGMGGLSPVRYSLPKSIAPGSEADPNGTMLPQPETKKLTLTQVVAATLANSTEIREVSFNPEIAEQEILERLGEFDPTAFSRVNVDDKKMPTTTFSEISRSDVALFETGIKQRSTWGTEWSTSYALTDSWDDFPGRTPDRRFEPVLAFQLKQPLLRDGAQGVNLAGVNIAKLSHHIALLDFQRKAEELATEAIIGYWLLYQTRVDLQTYQGLLTRAEETLAKVKGRIEIDATDVQIMQAKVSLNTRQALVLQAKKRITDAQDNLLRLMADPTMDLFSDTTIIPVTPPKHKSSEISSKEFVRQALTNNPAMRQAKAQVDISDINLLVSDYQKMPRLDLIASASTQTMDRHLSEAHELLEHTYHKSYGVGLVMEIPLGNRVRKAEKQRRKLERFKAISAVHTVSDRITVQVKEAIRRVHASFEEMDIQDQAVIAALAHLSALEDSEQIRERLTPEFLLVKLQAQDSLANAQRALAKAIVDYNVALAQLVQTTGQVLTLHELSVPKGKP